MHLTCPRAVRSLGQRLRVMPPRPSEIASTADAIQKATKQLQAECYDTVIRLIVADNPSIELPPEAMAAMKQRAGFDAYQAIKHWDLAMAELVEVQAYELGMHQLETYPQTGPKRGRLSLFHRSRDYV